MDTRPIIPASAIAAAPTPTSPPRGTWSTNALTSDAKAAEQSELQEAFTEFVGQTLFGSMLASMRKTVGKPAYMHGGRTEEVFQKQLDQKIVEELTEASAETIANPMFELFNLQQRP
jgi:hypothetical protein